jgi:hypothetical protein
MWGFLLNSSRILKDFRKNYNMSCYAMHPMHIILGRIFICTANLICNIYVLLCW